MERRRRMLRWALGLFIGGLLVLTYLSNTIQGLALPKVTVKSPSMGSLDLSVNEEGYLQAAYSAPLLPLGNWEVVKVHVEKGDRVKQGDPIVTFDTYATERSLEDEKTRYAQQQIKLSQLINELKPLLQQGADDAAVDRQKQAIESQKLEMSIAGRRIDDLQKQIRDGQVLRAPFAGIVTSLTAEEGTTASPGQQVCLLASDASGYVLSIAATGDAASSLQIGREVDVEIDDSSARRLKGTIASIEDASGQGEGGAAGSGDSGAKSVKIDVRGDGLKPGLKAAVYIDQQSERPGFKIPASALEADDEGTYVFALTVKEGPLGSSYFVKKTYVDTGETNDDTAVVLNGLLPDERIVTEASEPLGDGDRVRLE
ncbi:efflux RND transporter periplasmic adaptor subunit [Paenibacillus sacheonensis]|uniref:Efflux RND transporter periplasmic adaptor subunit n=1 Tax=Paenibacillus sacheonensis TaxID=742054 RepID=A0A7X5BWM5_9BACL|nr:RND family efflux transporter MFP subunit [Paenibacillus sacheonensis]NBC67682.1 efflux RND transporter periplasmic adaptor subunit [Paenibacillus sacheonensis]